MAATAARVVSCSSDGNRLGNEKGRARRTCRYENRQNPCADGLSKPTNSMAVTAALIQCSDEGNRLGGGSFGRSGDAENRPAVKVLRSAYWASRASAYGEATLPPQLHHYTRDREFCSCLRCIPRASKMISVTASVFLGFLVVEIFSFASLRRRVWGGAAAGVGSNQLEARNGRGAASN
jgi:hypothetical protein